MLLCSSGRTSGFPPGPDSRHPSTEQNGGHNAQASLANWLALKTRLRQRAAELLAGGLDLAQRLAADYARVRVQLLECRRQLLRGFLRGRRGGAGDGGQKGGSRAWPGPLWVGVPSMRVGSRGLDLPGPALAALPSWRCPGRPPWLLMRAGALNSVLDRSEKGVRLMQEEEEGAGKEKLGPAVALSTSAKHRNKRKTPATRLLHVSFSRMIFEQRLDSLPLTRTAAWDLHRGPGRPGQPLLWFCHSL